MARVHKYDRGLIAFDRGYKIRPGAILNRSGVCDARRHYFFSRRSEVELV